MLFSAVRNWVNNYPEQSHIVEQINRWYMSAAKLGDKVGIDRLIMNAINHDYFHRFVIQQMTLADVLRENNKTKKADRNKKLLEATIRTTNWVQKKAGSYTDPNEAVAYFVKLLGYVTKSVRVVSMVPGTEEDAYSIFETLNDRGLELAPLDLVKNLLFSRAEKYSVGSLAEMEARWNDMMSILGRSKVDAFLRAYWASRNSLIYGPRLFKAFKAKFDRPTDAYKASVELRRVAENYVAVHNPSDFAWSEYGPEARRRVEAISTIGATQLYPLILSAMERFTPHEMRRLLHLIEVLGVRYQLVARGRPSRMESLGSQVARLVFEKQVTTANQARAELAELYIPDDTFRLGFLTASEKDKDTARYMLRVLERQRKISSGNPNPKESGPDEVTREHIMPKTLNEDWRAYLGEDAERHAEYLNRLGNMCLLGEISNTRLGSKLFSAKVAKYAASNIETTKALAKYKEWRCEQIDQRQRALADLAVQAWRFQ